MALLQGTAVGAVLNSFAGNEEIMRTAHITNTVRSALLRYGHGNSKNDLQDNGIHSLPEDLTDRVTGAAP